ncbi:MAG: DUF3006 domain-containing protein [Oligoflexia bacterium]|nr:DUF3006 domain-containing protein [Oligoflexia bacterium]
MSRWNLHLAGLLGAGTLAVALHLTIDRIEGDWAVVEWPDGTFSDLPLALFPTGTREGQSLVLRVRPLAQPGVPKADLSLGPAVDLSRPWSDSLDHQGALAPTTTAASAATNQTAPVAENPR